MDRPEHQWRFKPYLRRNVFQYIFNMCRVEPRILSAMGRCNFAALSLSVVSTFYLACSNGRTRTWTDVGESKRPPTLLSVACSHLLPRSSLS